MTEAQLAQLRQEKARLEQAAADIDSRRVRADENGDDDEAMRLLLESTLVHFECMGLSEQIRKASKPIATLTIGAVSPVTVPDVEPVDTKAKEKAVPRTRSRLGVPVRISVPEATLGRLDAMAARIGIERNVLVQMAVFQALGRVPG